MSTNGTIPHVETPVQGTIPSPFAQAPTPVQPATAPAPTASASPSFSVTPAPVPQGRSSSGFKMPQFKGLKINQEKMILVLGKPTLPILGMGVVTWVVDAMGLGVGYRLFMPILVCAAMALRDLGDGDNRLKGEKLVFLGLRVETWFFLGFTVWVYFIPWAKVAIGDFLQTLR